MRLSGQRDELLSDLEAATGENTRAKAVETAARAYLRLVGGNSVEPGAGRLDELLDAADRDPIAADEVAALLDVDELPVEFQPAEWTVARNGR